MKRRQFISAGSAALAAAACGWSNDSLAARPSIQMQNSDEPGTDVKWMKGFIVSDDHFGMWHPVQPETYQIHQSIGAIVARFGDLDVFWDTGDVHHHNAKDFDRGAWSDTVPSGVGLLPFFLAAGNHDVISYGSSRSSDWPDVEQRTQALGSLPCRPYYSVDIKGIHFVALPQLIESNLVTQEALAWLELDLELNRERTTLVMTHNALAGTTSFHDSRVYRNVVNSPRVRALLDHYPNVVAWMHGHNHTWELVAQGGKFFVSNGRVGGFTPNTYKGNVGDGHLGGIYFELGPGHFTVRGYSALEGRFFDELPGYEHMSQTMQIKTSLDPAAPSALSWGAGLARDGQRIPFYQHNVAGPQEAMEIFLAGTRGAAFNDNSDLSLFVEDTTGPFVGRMAPGVTVEPGGKIGDVPGGWEFLDPGVRVLPPADPKATRSVCAPSRQVGQASHYRCVPGHTYQARVKLQAEGEGQARLEAFVFNNRLSELARQEGQWIKLTGQPQEISLEINVPADAAQGTLYDNPQSMLDVQLSAEVKFKDMSAPVRVTAFELRKAGAGERTRAASLKIAGQTVRHEGELAAGQFKRFEVAALPAAREAIEAGAKGSGLVTFLVRQSNLRWQVRNAPAAMTGEGALEVGPLRSRFSDRHEVVIAPLAQPDGPFVHRMRGVNRCRLHTYDPQTQMLKIEILEVTGDYCEVDVLNCPSPLSRTTGNIADGVFSPARNFFGFRPAEPGVYEIYF